MTAELPTRERILKAALQEFAVHGYAGARMERIARAADVNKAMIFYYYTSKNALYRKLIRNALAELLPKLEDILAESDRPEEFFSRLPQVYIRFFSGHQEFVRMVSTALIHTPESFVPQVREVLDEFPDSPSRRIPFVIRDWYERGLIAEADPLQLVLNVISLSLLSLIAAPMVEAVLDLQIEDFDRFLEARISSVTGLLKRGLLT